MMLRHLISAVFSAGPAAASNVITLCIAAGIGGAGCAMETHAYDPVELGADADALPPYDDDLDSAGEDVIDKIWGGNGEKTRAGVVRVFTTNSTCSAIVVNNQSIVTAAHCFTVPGLAQPGDTKTLSIGVVYRRSNGAYSCISGGSTISRADGSVGCSTLSSFTVSIKSDYNPEHEGDPADDIAVLKKTGGSFGLANSDFSLIYMDSLNGESRLEQYGYGLTSHAGTGSGRLMSGSGEINWFQASHFALIARGTRTCEGDSGGPAIIYMTKSSPEVHSVGLLSTGESSGVCTEDGGDQRYVRLSNEIAFIRDKTGSTCSTFTSPRSGRLIARCF